MRTLGTTSVRLLAGLFLVGLGFLVFAAPAASEGAALAVTATSPPYAKVGVVPDAVSVTFSAPIRSAGSDVIVTGPGVVSFETRTEVVGDTLREFLKPGPAGTYVVAWQAVGENGDNLEGSFSFTAEKAHVDYAAPPPTPVPSSPVPASPGVASGPSAGAVPPAPPGSAPGAGGGFDLPRVAVPVGVAVMLVGVSGLIAVANRRRPQRSA